MDCLFRIWLLLVLSRSIPGPPSFQASGELDPSFDPHPIASKGIRKIARQPDGKIVIGGSLSSVQGASRNGVARLNPDGSLDESFNPGQGTGAPIYEIAVQPDGKIIVCGSFTHFDGIPRSGIARLNADGTIDPTFDPGRGSRVRNCPPFARRANALPWLKASSCSRTGRS